MGVCGQAARFIS